MEVGIITGRFQKKGYMEIYKMCKTTRSYITTNLQAVHGQNIWKNIRFHCKVNTEIIYCNMIIVELIKKLFIATGLLKEEGNIHLFLL